MVDFIYSLYSLFFLQAECDLEGGTSTMESLANDETATSNVVSIRADHVTKVAAEMLMDFS
jgi:hypothetical protein